ncbi:molybdopterin cofactor-binding domain-containing protein [Flavisphingomonas formosensis]|uniref:molybdopterin cofactor-binding domain-containing protein n=1 Tax=Flavisphingomonas formosensis TaxID=861534 RepID=UPI0012FB4B0C|nr:molybdopterin cofactor-binding domain-containing protein [Sphingomonas formosensis]
MNPSLPAASPAELLARPGVLAVVRPRPDAVAEPFVVLLDDGRAIGLNGHVDLGTGIRTSLTQIVAEELDLALSSVSMVLGDTLWAPDQGYTTASETIQVTAIPLRRAAAQARGWLVGKAASLLGVSAEELEVLDGTISPRTGDGGSCTYAELIAGETIVLDLDDSFPLKDPAAYSIVGKSTRRVDIPGKVTGQWTFVHDVRLDGMLHGRVIRPPYGGRDSGAFIGRSLLRVDESSIAHMPDVKLVVIHDFVGVVAAREEDAEAAARALSVVWADFTPLPDLASPVEAVRANPSTPRILKDTGGVDEALASAAFRRSHTYVWPWHMHGSIGPCCSVAAFDAAGSLTVWSGTQTQHMLRNDLAILLDVAPDNIEIVRLETAGSYGRSGMDDVGADAALLARAVGAPVRVQLSRDQEHAWEPKGAAQLMDVDGGIDADGNLVAYDFATRYPSNMAPMLALLLTRKVDPVAGSGPIGDRNAEPPYDYENMRVVCHDQAPVVRAAFLRGVSAMPNAFAHESFIDEMAEAAGVDPVEYRARNISDPRARDLIRQTAERAGWVPKIAPGKEMIAPDVARGRGFAYSTYLHGPFPGKAAAAAAWVVDVEVNKTSGEVAVTKVVVAQDSGMVINPAGVRHQIEGNVFQSVSRVLMEQVAFNEVAVTSRDWSTYPILKFPEAPVVEAHLVPRPNDPPLGAGESASVPSAAAIVNAVYDATGVRFRELPLTPERVRTGLLEQNGSAPPFARKMKAGAPWLAAAGGLIAAAFTMLSPIKPAIAPIAFEGAGVFTSETIERGRLVAAAGNCVGCHTDGASAPNAGGHALRTPFGNVYSTNITPDVETGIGAWSYPAFERAMRQGISRDGRHLYPAFPYTAFARMTDGDLQALYAYLMSQPAVKSKVPETRLAFPMNVRPLMAGWNAMFHKAEVFTPDPARSERWNRGAYLVEGAGHCAACHSPRNALGAEATGARHLTGGIVDGWDAPALGAYSPSPIPWTEEAYYQYLRTGASAQHGATAGPMLAVVDELSALPDGDIRAMAHYLASRSPSGLSEAATTRRADALTMLGRAQLVPIDNVGARIFDGACAVCHANDNLDMFGGQVSLPLSSTVHSERPDNLIRTILNGVHDPAKGTRGAMPSFARQFSDEQLAELVTFVRKTQAAGKPAWRDVPGAIRRIRTERPR